MAQKCRFSQVIWDEVRKEKRKRLFFLCFSRLVVCCVPSLSWQIIAGVHKKNSGNSLFLVWVFGCGVSRACFVLSQVEYEGDIPPGWGRLTGQQEADRFWCGGARRLLQFKLAPAFDIDIYIYGVFVARGSRWGASLGVFTGHSETVLHANVTEDDNQPLWWCGTKSHTRHFKHTCGANVVISHKAYPVDLLDLFAMCHRKGIDPLDLLGMLCDVYLPHLHRNA